MFSLFRKKNKFITEAEHKQILRAILQAEKETSGEVRVFIESKCSYVDALDRAKEVFERLKMYQTSERNAILIYLAVDHHQLAIFGDEGIHKKVGSEYWSNLVSQMSHHFRNYNITEGLCLTITELALELKKNFPYHKHTDTNELPDDIEFGR